jgi:hypothetical protein
MKSSLCLVACLLLVACASDARNFWSRTDGGPIMATQYQSDATICRGESQKANASGVVITGGGIPGAVAAINRSEALGDVYVGCMAERGYLLRPQCPPTANGACLPQLRANESYATEGRGECRTPTDTRLWLPLCAN